VVYLVGNHCRNRLGYFQFKGDNRGHYNKTSESPMDILKKRYANGEISKEEFEKMKKEII
jgi:uncharacterized membrane protein